MSQQENDGQSIIKIGVQYGLMQGWWYHTKRRFEMGLAIGCPWIHQIAMSLVAAGKAIIMFMEKEEDLTTASALIGA